MVRVKKLRIPDISGRLFLHLFFSKIGNKSSKNTNILIYTPVIANASLINNIDNSLTSIL